MYQYVVAFANPKKRSQGCRSNLWNSSPIRIADDERLTSTVGSNFPVEFAPDAIAPPDPVPHSCRGLQIVAKTIRVWIFNEDRSMFWRSVAQNGRPFAIRFAAFEPRQSHESAATRFCYYRHCRNRPPLCPCFLTKGPPCRIQSSPRLQGFDIHAAGSRSRADFRHGSRAFEKYSVSLDDFLFITQTQITRETSTVVRLADARDLGDGARPVPARQSTIRRRAAMPWRCAISPWADRRAGVDMRREMEADRGKVFAFARPCRDG